MPRANFARDFNWTGRVFNHQESVIPRQAETVVVPTYDVFGSSKVQEMLFFEELGGIGALSVGSGTTQAPDQRWFKVYKAELAHNAGTPFALALRTRRNGLVAESILIARTPSEAHPGGVGNFTISNVEPFFVAPNWDLELFVWDHHAGNDFSVSGGRIRLRLQYNVLDWGEDSSLRR